VAAAGAQGGRMIKGVEMLAFFGAGFVSGWMAHKLGFIPHLFW
jgi:hypothetical protein